MATDWPGLAVASAVMFGPGLVDCEVGLVGDAGGLVKGSMNIVCGVAAAIVCKPFLTSAHCRADGQLSEETKREMKKAAFQQPRLEA